LDKNNFIVVRPRYADFNLQGILRVGVYPELICECQLHLFDKQFGLPLKVFTDRGERWHITEYFIRVKTPVKAMDEFIVEAALIGVLESRLRVRFRFYNKSRKLVHADGYICFDLVDDRSNQPKAIPQHERALLEQYVDESEA